MRSTQISSMHSMDIVRHQPDIVQPQAGYRFPECPRLTKKPFIGKQEPTQKRIHLSPAAQVIEISSASQREFPTSWERISFFFAKTEKPAILFGLRASFTLAAIYSRGTCRPTTIDVLMFHFRVRNGTGWGHQAMTTRLRLALFCSSVCLIIICACGLLFVFQRQAGIRVACFVCFCRSLTLGYICYQAEIACHRGGV